MLKVSREKPVMNVVLDETAGWNPVTLLKRTKNIHSESFRFLRIATFRICSVKWLRWKIPQTFWVNGFKKLLYSQELRNCWSRWSAKEEAFYYKSSTFPATPQIHQLENRTLLLYISKKVAPGFFQYNASLPMSHVLKCDKIKNWI